MTIDVDCRPNIRWLTNQLKTTVHSDTTTVRYSCSSATSVPEPCSVYFCTITYKLRAGYHSLITYALRKVKGDFNSGLTKPVVFWVFKKVMVKNIKTMVKNTKTMVSGQNLMDGDL